MKPLYRTAFFLQRPPAAPDVALTRAKKLATVMQVK
jgi:hypothetical protein